MRTLVTGASGFLGRHLVPALLAAGHHVACLSRSPDDLPPAWRDLPKARVEPSGRELRALCADFRPELAVHLAALYVNEHRFEEIAPLVQANVALGAQLLESLAESGCDAMVWAGTSWQHYEGADYRPANFYAATKQAFSTLATYYLDSAGLRLLELHLYDSYGDADPRPRLINQLQASASNGQTLSMSPGEQRLHLVHVEDLVAGFLRACDVVLDQAPGDRKVYRLPSEKALSLRELVSTFNAIDPAHPAIVEWGARTYRRREVFHPWEGASTLPGWQPKINLRTGLERLRGST